MKKIILFPFLLLNIVCTNAQCWKSVSAGLHQCIAIKTNGTLWGCGYNNYGELGDGTFANKLSPNPDK